MAEIKFYTTGRAAEELLVTPVTVRQWINNGILECRTTPGGHHRIPVSEVVRLKRSMEEKLSDKSLV